jgi:hypothetical protein
MVRFLQLLPDSAHDFLARCVIFMEQFLKHALYIGYGIWSRMDCAALVPARHVGQNLLYKPMDIFGSHDIVILSFSLE